MSSLSPPRLSIITAVYNAGSSLGRMFDSVSLQSDGGWEHVIVDDGSDDDSAALVAARAASDARIRLIQQDNTGAAQARNRGLKAARGEWVLFLDADDTLSSRHIERFLAHASAATDAVCCGHVRRDHLGRIVSRQPPPRLDRGTFTDVAVRPPVIIHAIMVRRSLLISLGGFDASLRTNEDWDLWARLARSGARVTVASDLYADYWTSAGSLTHQGARMVADATTVLERLNGPDPRVAAPLAALTEGFPGVDVAGGALTCALWCVGVETAAGGDALAVASALRYPVDTRRHPVLVASLLEGLMVGSGRSFGDLIALWPDIAPRLTMALAAVAQAVAAPGLEDRLVTAIEREVVRTATIHGVVRVGGTAVTPLRLVTLWRGLETPADARAVILKASWIRPRALGVFDLPVGATLPPSRVLRLIIQQVLMKLSSRLIGRWQAS